MVYYVYLLKCGKREYIGATTNISRRVKQHNGELQGGARKTKGGVWRVHRLATGFATWNDCLKFEFALKRRQDKTAAMVEMADAIGCDIVICPDPLSVPP